MKRLAILLILLSAPVWADPNPSYRPSTVHRAGLRLTRSLLLDVGSSLRGGGFNTSLSSTWTASQTFNDDVSLIFGTGSDANIVYNTAHTPDSLFIGVGQDSRCIVIAEKTDIAFDFAHAPSTHPCVAIHSANQNTGQYLLMAHDATDAVIRAGAGQVKMVNSGVGASAIFQNENAGGFSGVEYMSNAASVTVFTGYSNASNEFRFNHIGSASGRRIRFMTNSVERVNINDTSLGLTRDMLFGWANSTTDATTLQDPTLSRDSSGALQLGQDVNGAATAQIIKAHDGITGTDVAGASLSLAGGTGTGAGAGGNAIIQTSPSLATGTTQQTLTNRWMVVAKAKALVDATATAVFTVSGLGAHTRTGGLWDLCVEAGDGTNDQVACCQASWNAVDTTAGAGGETCTVFLLATCSALLSGAASSGTLTVTADTATGTDTCSYRLTATGSLTETTLQTSYAVLKNGTVGTINPQ